MPIRKPVEYGAVLKKTTKNLLRETRNLKTEEFRKLWHQRDFQTRYAMALSKAMTKVGLRPKEFHEARRQIHALGRKMAVADSETTPKNERVSTNSLEQIIEIIRTKKSERAAASFGLVFANEMGKIVTSGWQQAKK